MRRVGLSLAVACGLALLAAAPVAAAGPPYQQVTADPPVTAPATPSCTEQVVVHDFANSYYAPGLGTLTPPPA